MSGGKVDVSGWRKNIISALVLLVVAAWVAKTAYEWLMPLVPGVLVIVGLLVLVGGLIKLRQR